MTGLPYRVENNASFEGLRTTDFPNIQAEITRADPLLIEMIRRVQATGTPEHFTAMWTVGGIEIKDAPSVIYRSDNPAKPKVD